MDPKVIPNNRTHSSWRAGALAAFVACALAIGDAHAEGLECVVLPHSAWERVRLNWRMDAPLAGLEGELRVMVHLLDEAGTVVRTFDHPFPGDWSVGDVRSYQIEIFQSALAPPLAKGEYRLMVGLYAADRRWPVTGHSDRCLG